MACKMQIDAGCRVPREMRHQPSKSQLLLRFVAVITLASRSSKIANGCASGATQTVEVIKVPITRENRTRIRYSRQRALPPAEGQIAATSERLLCASGARRCTWRDAVTSYDEVDVIRMGYTSLSNHGRLVGCGSREEIYSFHRGIDLFP
jgi:hypothetical protein